MKYKHYDPYITYTSQEEIEICENCPYDDCIGKSTNECDYYRKQKRLLKKKTKKE